MQTPPCKEVKMSLIFDFSCMAHMYISLITFTLQRVETADATLQHFCQSVAVSVELW